MVPLSMLIMGSEAGADLEEIWGKFPSFHPFREDAGAPASLSPATAVGESLELPGDEHPPWKTFISLHPGQNGLLNVCREAEMRYVEPVQSLPEAADSTRGGR